MLKREVVAGEGDLDQDHAEGEQGAGAVDGAARGQHPALVALAPDQGRDGGGDHREEGQRQGGAAEASCHSRS